MVLFKMFQVAVDSALTTNGSQGDIDEVSVVPESKIFHKRILLIVIVHR